MRRPSVNRGWIHRFFFGIRPGAVQFHAELPEHQQKQFLPTLGIFVSHDLYGFAKHLANSLFCTHWFLLVASAVSVLFAVPVYPQIPRGDQMVRRFSANKNVFRRQP